MPLDASTLALLAAAAFAAGFVDSIAGGGGLITLPALLLAGVPPVEAIATNKFQGTFGVATASHTFWRAGLIDGARILPAIACTLAGAALGSLTLLHVDSGWLAGLLPPLLVAVALYFALLPRLTRAGAGRMRVPFAVLAPILGATIGFYDGFLGPGTGSFLLLGFVALGGLGMMDATATAKPLNFASNLASFLVFAASGHILFLAGLVMAAGQVAGAAAGSRLALAKGAALIRPLVVVTTLSIAAKLLADPANPMGQWLRSVLSSSGNPV